MHQKKTSVQRLKVDALKETSEAYFSFLNQVKDIGTLKELVTESSLESFSCT